MFSYEELARHDKLDLDMFWLKDESVEYLENLRESKVLATEIIDDLQVALAVFGAIQAALDDE